MIGLMATCDDEQFAVVVKAVCSNLSDGIG